MRVSKRGISPELAHHAANITLLGRFPKRYESEELPRDGVHVSGSDLRCDFRKSPVDPVGVRISSVLAIRSGSL